MTSHISLLNPCALEDIVMTSHMSMLNPCALEDTVIFVVGKGEFLPSICQAPKIEVGNLSLSTKVKIPAKRSWPRTCLNFNQDLAQDLSSIFSGLNELGQDLVYLGHDSCVCYPQIFVAMAMSLVFLNNDSWVPWP